MNELHDLIMTLINVYNNNIIKNKYLDLLIKHKYVNNSYHLTKDPSNIELSDLYKIIAISCNNCNNFDNCSCCCFYEGLNITIINYLESYTLEDIIKGYCI